MTTFPLRSVKGAPSFRVFAPLAAALTLMFEVFAEAQDVARAAHRRCPFAEW